MNAIEIQHLTKIYKIFERPIDRVKESLLPFHRRYSRDFYALRDFSLDVPKGETIGIIGKNGAGKSTLLKIITGVLTPTEGSVRVQGRIASLLELGAGFNPEMDGIENIYMNGTVMGIGKEEMEALVPGIVAFADIGDFIHQPVKTYSSGMFARLAFAVNAFVTPDILIVDEALSVGDVEFQARCYRKFEELRQSGCTILFVTHDLNAVISFCSSAILMERGELIDKGTPKEIVNLYKRRLAGRAAKEEPVGSTPGVLAGAAAHQAVHVMGAWKQQMKLNPDVEEYGDKAIEIQDFAVMDASGSISPTTSNAEPCDVCLAVHVREVVEHPIFAVSIKDIKGNVLIDTNTDLMGQKDIRLTPGQDYVVRFHARLPLREGNYILNFGCTEYVDKGLRVHHRLYDAAFLQMVSPNKTAGLVDVQPDITIEERTAEA